MALSRLASSNSSSTKPRSWPLSPRNFSSVRGRRPSPSAKFWRSSVSRAVAALLVGRLRLAQQTLELGPDRVHVDGDPDALDRRQPDAEGPLHEQRPLLGRPVRHERGEGVRRPARDARRRACPTRRGRPGGLPETVARRSWLIPCSRAWQVRVTASVSQPQTRAEWGGRDDDRPETPYQSIGRSLPVSTS